MGKGDSMTDQEHKEFIRGMWIKAGLVIVLGGAYVAWLHLYAIPRLP